MGTKTKPAEVILGGCVQIETNRLFDIAWALLAVALSGKGFFGPALLAGFQIEGVTLDLFDDVFLLHFAFKTAQRALKSLAFLQMNFCQLRIHHPSKRSCNCWTV